MEEIFVDPDYSSTQAFMERFDARPEECINTLVLATKSGGGRTHSLALVPADAKLDGKALKRALGGKTSFLPMDAALELTGMERDSIGPVDAPAGLDVVADPAGLIGERFIIGGGLTKRKYILNRDELLALVTKPCEDIYTPR